MKFGINQAISQTITQLSCIQLETPSSRLWNFWWIKTYTTFKATNILATFQNDPWKFTDVRALMVIFHVRSWKMGKKFAKIFFWRLWNNPELILMNMFRPIYMPNLVTLAWKMSSGMSKEAGSLNGLLCAYLMRQNLHDRTCPRS